MGKRYNRLKCMVAAAAAAVMLISIIYINVSCDNVFSNDDVHITAAAAIEMAGRQTKTAAETGNELTESILDKISGTSKEKGSVLMTAAVVSVRSEADQLEKMHEENVFAAETETAGPMMMKNEGDGRYTITVNGSNVKVSSDADTVEGVLIDAGIYTGEHDVTTPARVANSRMTDVIKVRKMIPVHVTADGRTVRVYAGEGSTVSDAVSLSGIPVGKDDTLSRPADSEISPGEDILISRIMIKTAVRTETIKYPTKVVQTAAIKYGRTRVAKPGRNGKAKVTYNVIFKNGKAAESEVVKTQYITRPVTRIIEKGKKYKAEYSMNATAYCDRGYTAGGLLAGEGRIAVDPNVIPLGTKVYVSGYGYAVAADTGGAIKGHRIDLWFPTNGVCEQFGRRQVKLYVLNY